MMFINKLKKLKILVFISTLMIFGASCSKEEIKDEVSSAVQAVENRVKANEVMDTWTSECRGSTLLPLSVKESYEYSGEDMVYLEEYFVSSDCLEKAVDIKYTGVFSIQSDVSEVPDAKQVEIQYNNVEVTPKSEAGVTALEVVHFCTQKVWSLNVAVDLTDQSDATLCPLANVPYTVFDILLVKEDVLYFGLNAGDRDKTTAELRPVEIDLSRPFSKIDKDL